MTSSTTTTSPKNCSIILVMFYTSDIPRVTSSSWPTSWRRPPTRPSRSSTPRRAVPARAAWARRRASSFWRRRPRRPSRCPRRPARPSRLAAPGRACAGYRRGAAEAARRWRAASTSTPSARRRAVAMECCHWPSQEEHCIASTRRAGGRRDGDQARTRRARGFGNLSFAFFAGLAAGFFAPAGLGDLGVFGLGFDGFVPPTHSPLS